MYNPIPSILPSDLFQALLDLDLINTKRLRDYEIRHKYEQLRATKTSSEAIEEIRNEYPYLQFDTVRKIIYSVKLTIAS